MPCLQTTQGLGPGPFPDLLVFYVEGAVGDDKQWVLVDIFDISEKPARYVYPLRVPTPEWMRLKVTDVHIESKKDSFVFRGARLLGKVPKGKNQSESFVFI